MEIQQDFRELLAFFNARGVEYVVVGAHALAFHGSPRYTGDMDLYVRPDAENARRVLEALDEFGFASAGLKMEDLAVRDKIVRLGVPPVRVDILTSIAGVSWEEAASGREEGFYGDLRVNYLGKAQFVSNKRAVGRLKDLADLEAIGAG